MALVAVCAYIWGVVMIAEGHGLVMFVGMIVFSPIAAIAIRWLLEEGDVRGMFSLRNQSWAFVLGDFVCLPFALLWMTRGWHKPSGVLGQLTWVWVAAGIGCAVAIIFHVFDRPRYVTAGHAAALRSPTKLWHDFVVYPVVAGVVVWSMAPQLTGDWSWYTAAALLFLAGWLGMGVRDTVTGVDTTGQHPAWDSRQFTAIT